MGFSSEFPWYKGTNEYFKESCKRRFFFKLKTHDLETLAPHTKVQTVYMAK